MSNGTYGAGGVGNYESISPIIGAKYDDRTGESQTGAAALQTVLEGLLDIYIRDTAVTGVAQLETANLNATTVLCDLYQGMNSVVPPFFRPLREEGMFSSKGLLTNTPG
ncbi:hypothetical protein ColTof4_01412 [Colletotrichum tofieldiae]|nr:hypothetical protein ColTof4_01412 [Colletotrichum tofieldiae]